MAVAPNRYLIARVRARDLLFQGIGPGGIASLPVVAEIGYQVERWLADEAVACDRRELMEVAAEVQHAIVAAGLLYSATSSGAASSRAARCPSRPR